jgi:restriction endonuclease S subunit
VPDNPIGWTSRPFVELVESPSRSVAPTTPRSSYRNKGLLPVVDQGKDFVPGFTDDESLAYRGALPVIVFGDHTREWKYVDFPFVVGADGTQLLRPRSTGLDPKFLYYALSSIPLQNLGYSRHFKLLKEATVNFPVSLSEQRKIAAILSSIDDTMMTSRRVLEQLLETKRALRLNLLARGEPGVHGGFRATELGDIPIGWSVIPLEDVVEILDTRRRPLNSQERKRIPGDFPYYGANGMVDRIGKWIFDEPLLLVAEDGGYFDEFATRQIAYLVDGKCWINNHAHVLRVKKPHDRRWVFYSLVHRDIQPYINAGTRSKLNQADLRRIPIPIPEPDEQRRICDFLEILESRARAEEDYLTGIETVKAGLLKSLLSGEVRVTPGEAAA